MNEIEGLRSIMARLRDPDTGCPWDIEQDFRSIAPYTIEEAFEVADAIERGDMADLREELGDLLFQVVYHTRMAEEEGAFDFPQVVEGICKKLIRRHPHVFADEEIADAEQQTRAWENHKALERHARGVINASVLDEVPRGLPALVRAQKLGKKAGTVGFDWPDVGGVMEKLREELTELQEVVDSDPERVAEEVGDLLFAVVNLCRHKKLDAEAVLRRANTKFEKRFRALECRLREEGGSPAESSLEEMDRLWNQAKAADRGD